MTHNIIDEEELRMVEEEEQEDLAALRRVGEILAAAGENEDDLAALRRVKGMSGDPADILDIIFKMVG